MRRFCCLPIVWTICIFISFACGKEDTAPQPTLERAPPTAAEKKRVLSEAKLQEVRTLRDKLAEKVTRLTKTNEQFDREIADSAKTIQAETSQESTKAFEQAIQNRRVKAALEAIQKAQAYKEIVDRASQLTSEAIVETEGVEKQLRLDIIMLASVDEAKLDELLAKLDLVINKIQPQAKELVLKDEQTNLKPLEDIFKELVTPPAATQIQSPPREEKPAPNAAPMKDDIIAAPHTPANPTTNGHTSDDDTQKAQKGIPKIISFKSSSVAKNKTATTEVPWRVQYKDLPVIKLAQKSKIASCDNSGPRSNEILWSPANEKQLAIRCSHDLSIYNIETKQETLLRRINNDAHYFLDAAWYATGGKLATISRAFAGPLNHRLEGSSTYLDVWSVDTRQHESILSMQIENNQEMTRIVGWRNNLIVITDFPRLAIFDTTEKKQIAKVPGVGFSWRDDNSFYTITNQDIVVYDIASGEVVEKIDICTPQTPDDTTSPLPPCPSTWSVAFSLSPDLKNIALRTEANKVHSLSILDLENLNILNLNYVADRLIFEPCLWSTDKNGEVTLLLGGPLSWSTYRIDLATNALTAYSDLYLVEEANSFSGRSNFFLSYGPYLKGLGNNDNILALHSIKTGSIIALVKKPSSSIEFSNYNAWSTKQRYFASSEYQTQNIFIWDMSPYTD